MHPEPDSIMSDRSPMTGVHERMVVVLAQARDQPAFQELVRRYERRVLYYIRRMIGETPDSLDVLQDVWLRVFKTLPRLRAPEAFRVFLYRVAHDVAVDHLRRRRRDVPVIDGEPIADDATDPWNELEALERSELVHQLLADLSPEHREVLTLRFLESLDVAEIAAVTSTSEGTVKSRLHYAKLALRRRLEDADHE
jgi:RNA polymerase sigma-70 factor, ECF subfamily